MDKVLGSMPSNSKPRSYRIMASTFGFDPKDLGSIPNRTLLNETIVCIPAIKLTYERYQIIERYQIRKRILNTNVSI